MNVFSFCYGFQQLALCFKYRMARNFRGTKFLRFICLRPRKLYPQCKPHPFLPIGVAYFRSVDYFREFSKHLCDGNVILVAWTSYPNYQILLAPCLWKYRRPPWFWLMWKWRACWRVCWRRKGAMSSCRPMSMMVHIIGLSLTWLLLANGCIQGIFIYPRTIAARSPITALSCVMWV